MDAEKNNTDLNSSIDKSVQVEQILEFYKDKLDDTEIEHDELTDTEEEKSSSLKSAFYTIITKIPFLKEKIEFNTSIEDIQNHSYGLNEKGRTILYRAISAVISLIIILVSFILAFYLPGNDTVYEKQLEQLRSDESYVSLKSRHDALKTEVDELKNSNAEKALQIASIEDIDNTKAELRTQISEKTHELNTLNAQISAKRAEIEALDKEILSKAPPETVRPPGKYIVGKNIPAGRYYVTGTGKFMVATASGRSKVNTTLGSTPLEIKLDNNDVVKFDSKVKFTTLN